MFAYYSTPNPLEHFYYGRNFFDEMMAPLVQSFSFLLDDTTPQSTPSACCCFGGAAPSGCCSGQTKNPTTARGCCSSTSCCPPSSAVASSCCGDCCTADTRAPFSSSSGCCGCECESESTADQLMQLFCSMMFPACCPASGASCCSGGGDATPKSTKSKQPAASPAKVAQANEEPAPASATTETAPATATATATGGEPAPATATPSPAPEKKEKEPAAVHGLAPRCDVEETADEVLLHVELPGVPRELVHLDADPARGMLTLTAHAPRRDADYRRVFRLPQSCQPRLGEITAACADGVMTIRCPKATTAPQPVIIPIQ